jgi:hypothetical protein
MRLKTLWFSALLVGLALAVPAGWAEQQPDPELLEAKKFLETAGIPGDKWIEGETMVPHVAPARHFNATMLYYPGTEELQADEVRVIFMGATYYPNQSQSGMSIFVELGNGDNFVFDLGIGSLRNYNSFSIPFSTIDKIFFTHLHMDHMSDLPYFTMFRPIQGGWTPLHIYGPSGSDKRLSNAEEGGSPPHWDGARLTAVTARRSRCRSARLSRWGPSPARPCRSDRSRAEARTPRGRS